MSVLGSEDEYAEPVKKSTKRGFAKIDVVDVILSDEAKKLSKSSVFEKLTETTISKGFQFAPTYRLAPKKKFDCDVVLRIVQECLEKDAKDMTYSERECQNACKRISYYIRRAVKHLSYDRNLLMVNQYRRYDCSTVQTVGCVSTILNFLNIHDRDRYRIICQVRIVEKQNQGLETHTGFLWDPDFDGFVTHSVDTQSFIAQAVVYGIYKD